MMGGGKIIFKEWNVCLGFGNTLYKIQNSFLYGKCCTFSLQNVLDPCAGWGNIRYFGIDLTTNSIPKHVRVPEFQMLKKSQKKRENPRKITKRSPKSPILVFKRAKTHFSFFEDLLVIF
jgi:hypothetical protein